MWFGLFTTPFHRLESLIGKLTKRLEDINLVLIREIQMAQTGLEALRLQIERSITVQASAIALIEGLAERIRELAEHPDQKALSELADDLSLHADELAKAVDAHGAEKVEPQPTEEDGE